MHTLRAAVLMNLFVSRSKHYGEDHQKYADTLLDYGFFLLNVDAIVKSVHAYTVSCEIESISKVKIVNIDVIVASP